MPLKKMLSDVQGASDVPLLDLTIAQLLKRAVDDCPDSPAIISVEQGKQISYQELEHLSESLAKALVELGLEQGDRIGIWSPNNFEWIVLMYAAARLGLILVNVNPAYRPGELKYALNHVGCKALILADRFKTSDYPTILEQVAPDISCSDNPEHHLENIPSLRTLVLISDEQRDGYLAFNELLNRGRHSDIDIQPLEASVDESMAVNIQFTSGTTGSPKGATLTHKNIVNNATNVGRGIELSKGDKVCAPVPLYHCFGMVMAVLACASHRATLVLPNQSFDPLGTLSAVQNYQCTALYGVPTMFSAMLEHPEFQQFDLSSLRTGIVAGSLCNEQLMGQIINDMHMGKVTNCYGMTETSPVSFQSAVDDPMNKRISTVGTVHPHVRVKVIDSNGNTVSRGQPGEICTKGYSVMQGYWADEEKTRESVVDGWMLTGDQGVIDEDGYCSIVGRIKDTIIRGGENIAPKEIEEYLVTHPFVSQAQVFGVSDQKYGEIVAAWIQLKDGKSLTQDEVSEFCKDKIAYFKIPAHVRFVDEFPLTVTGKIQKFKMRETMEQELRVS